MDMYVSPFFVSQGGSTAQAKTICFGGTWQGHEYPGCEVRLDCLRYALDAEEKFGVWGGRSHGERKALLHLVRGESDGEPTDQELEDIEQEEDPDKP